MLKALEHTPHHRAIASVLPALPAQVHNMESMSEVRLLADEILATGKNISLLINNAGGMCRLEAG